MATKPIQKKTATKTKSGAGGNGHLFAVTLLGKFIEWLRGKMTAGLLNFFIKWLSLIGHYALIVAAVLGFIFCIIVAIRANSFSAFIEGIAWVILVAVVQYTAYRFSTAGDTLIKNNPTRLSSKAFLDCLAFLVLLAGVVIFIVNTVVAIRGGGIDYFLIGLGILIFCWFVTLVAFNPETASMEIVEEASAGEEAIGIITFFLKKLLRLVPIVFGVGIVVYTILLLIDAFGLFGSEFKLAQAYHIGRLHAQQILLFGLLPFLSYLIFVVFFLSIDVIRAILAIPGKLDKLSRK